MSAPEPTLRVFLSGNWAGHEELQAALAASGETAVIAGRPITTAVASRPDAVLHIASGPAVAAELAAVAEHTRAPIVLLTPLGGPDVVETALRAGVADVLPLPVAVDTLLFTVHKARAAQGPAKPAAGRVVTVFSPKGGTGKSVIASNLAAHMAAWEGSRTLLVDLDLQFGDAAIMLGIEPAKTLFDLATAPGSLDAEKLLGYTTIHSSGLAVLPAPIRPEDAELVGDDRIGALLDVAREVYDTIVVDTSPFFHGAMLTTLDRTDDLLLVCVPDVPTLKNVRLTLQTLDLLGFPDERIRLVLNRSTERGGLSASDVAAVLEHPVAYELPTDPAVAIGVNRGEPATLAGRNLFAASLAAAAASLSGLAATGGPRQRGSLLRRLALGRAG